MASYTAARDGAGPIVLTWKRLSRPVLLVHRFSQVRFVSLCTEYNNLQPTYGSGTAKLSVLSGLPRNGVGQLRAGQAD